MSSWPILHQVSWGQYAVGFYIHKGASKSRGPYVNFEYKQLRVYNYCK